MKSTVTSDTESRSLHLPQSSLSMRLIVRLALLSEIAVMNFSEGLISVGPFVQVTEGLDVIKVLKGTVKVISFPETYRIWR